MRPTVSCMRRGWDACSDTIRQAVTWKWKDISGVAAVDVDATALGTILANHVNTYVNNHKRNYMRDGVCAGG